MTLRAALTVCCLSACARHHGEYAPHEPEPEGASGDRAQDPADASDAGFAQPEGANPAAATDLIDMCVNRSFTMDPAALANAPAPCALELEWPPEFARDGAIADPAFVNLYVGERLRPMSRDPMLPADDGWRLESDGRAVMLLGAACRDARAGATIRVELACAFTIRD